MEKHLERIYKEEFIRAKARKDFAKSITPPKSLVDKLTKYGFALVYLTLGTIGFYALYEIYTIFM